MTRFVLVIDKLLESIPSILIHFFLDTVSDYKYYILTRSNKKFFKKDESKNPKNYPLLLAEQ